MIRYKVITFKQLNNIETQQLCLNQQYSSLEAVRLSHIMSENSAIRYEEKI